MEAQTWQATPRKSSEQNVLPIHRVIARSGRLRLRCAPKKMEKIVEFMILNKTATMFDANVTCLKCLEAPDVHAG